MRQRTAYQGLLAGALGVFLAAGVWADVLNTAAAVLARRALALKHQRLSVLLFPYENGDLSSGSSLVSNQVATLLAQKRGVRVIERSNLASVLSEMKLEISGVVASSTTASMGEIMGVDAVVTGTLQDLKNGVTLVNMRLVQLPTGEVLTGATAEVDRVWDDDPAAPPAPEEDEQAASGPSPTSAGYDTPTIFTPWARGGGGSGSSAASGGAFAGTTSPGPASAGPEGSAFPEQVIVVEGYPKRHRPKAQAAASQAGFLYALGVTLDHDGHPQQASRYYRNLLEQAPAASPLREKAENRLKASTN